MVQACTRWSGWYFHADCPKIGGGVSWVNAGCTLLLTHGEHTGILEDSTMWGRIIGILVILVLALPAAARAAAAQSPRSISHIGFLLLGYPAPLTPFWEVFRQSL